MYFAYKYWKPFNCKFLFDFFALYIYMVWVLHFYLVFVLDILFFLFLFIIICDFILVDPKTIQKGINNWRWCIHVTYYDFQWLQIGIHHNYIFIENALMKATKCLAPPMDVVFIGPHISECTISKGLVARLHPCLEMQPYVICLQCMLHKTKRMWG